MNTEELYQIVKNNLQNLTIVDDVLEIPEINSISLESFDLHLKENEQYKILRSTKKDVQLKLNLYNSPNEYANCQILKEDIYSGNSAEILNYQKSRNEHDEESLLIENICYFIKCYQFVLHAELKIVEKNENVILRTQIVRRDSSNYFNEIKDNNDYSIKPCNKCSFINKKPLANCELCFGSLTNSISYKKTNHKVDIKILSLPIVNNHLSKSQCSLSNKVNLFPKGLRSFILRYKFYKTDEWKCNKCGLNNNTNICIACLNSSPNINKWKCENCRCLNKITNENCKNCGFINPNLIVCLGCKKLKIISERIRCDNCWLKESLHFKTNKVMKKL